ncbi:MFS transporter [Povalibacter sp.]|uniref:MFS transporter n=1 Tax=Povalibacter sp. TaxID=1962978 RepID=UPI002F3FB5FA
MKNTNKESEFQRGWRTLAAASLGNAAGLSGLAFYTFGVFVIPLTAAFGWTRGEISSAASFLTLGTAITAPLVGTLIDRIGARKVALWSLLGLALAYAAMTQLAGTIGVFYAAWLAIALIGGGTTPVVWTRTVNLWFDRSRGLALGLTLAGSGLAGMFGPVFCAALIERFGWQAGYLGVGALIAFVAIPVVALLLKERPAPRQASVADGGADDLAGLTFQEAVRTGTYWKIAGGFLLVSGAIAGLIINIVPLLQDRGMSPLQAAQIAGSMGIAVMLGRVIVGLLLDRFSARLVAGVMLSSTALGCLAMSLSGAPTWVLMLSVVSLGFAAAAEVDLVAFLVSRYFGMKAYGKIYGSQLTAFYLGAAAGPLLMGLSYDHFGGYTEILYAVAAILVFGAIVLATLGTPPDNSTTSAVEPQLTEQQAG